MNTNPQPGNASPLYGNLLQLSDRREIAIFFRDGLTWVADFRNGHIEVCSLSAWLSDYGNSRVLRRMALVTITPLSGEVAAHIERQLQRMAPPRANPEVARVLTALVTGLRGALRRIPGLAYGKPASATAWRKPG